MAFSFFFVLLAVFFMLRAYAVPEGPHINTLNVLLPPRTTNPVSFRLQGSGGCFTWSWDHHDLINVKVEYNGTQGCSDSATITSLAPYKGRRVTSVYAADKISGLTMRCEVFIDNIAKVRISHHSLQLDLDGLATLRMHGYDMEDNVFSSLVGIQFLWKILPSGSSAGLSPPSLMHVPLKDTPLSDCGCACGDIDTRIELEDKGVGSDLFVVKGVSVGQEGVSVTVLEPSLEGLGDGIMLTVAEAISMEPPSPLYVLIGAQVQYTLKTLRYKIPSVVQLPSPYYHWSVVNTSIAEIDKLMGSLFTKRVGSSNVVVEDIRVPNFQQFSSLHVVIPSKLQLYLIPLSSREPSQHVVLGKETLVGSLDVPWYLVVGWDYVVQVLAFSPESGSWPLFLTKGSNLTFAFENSPYWKSFPIPEDVQIEQGWRNGSLIKTFSEGVGRLAASLEFRNDLYDRSQNEILTVEQEVLLCNPVEILLEDGLKGEKILLPWNSKVHEEYQLKAQGGCGAKHSDYRWLSMDLSIADVNSAGLLYVKKIGQVTIRAVASTNPLNADEVIVDVAYPTSIARFEGFPVEAEVGNYIPVGVVLRSPEGGLYSKCESFFSLFEWEGLGRGSSFLRTNDSKELGLLSKDVREFKLPRHVCGWAKFLAARPGRATVSASLAFDDLSEMGSSTTLRKSLSVSWTVAAFLPLTVMQIGDGRSHGGYHCGMAQLESCQECQCSNLILAPGSRMKVMLRGGPERWGQGVEFLEGYDIVSLEGESLLENLEVSHVNTVGGRLYDIKCLSLGNYILMFFRGNSFGEGHSPPVLALTNLSVICSLPSSITLLVDDAGHTLSDIRASVQAERDQSHVHKTPIMVVCSKTLRVAAVALYKRGIPFANASSLSLSWILSDCGGLAHWEGHDSAQNHIQYGRWEELLVLHGTAGQCLLQASLVPLSGKSALASLRLFDVADILTDAIKLQLVMSLRVEPKFVLLYHDNDAKAVLSIMGGSNLVEAHSNDTRVAIVLEQPLAPEFSRIAVAARGLGTALVTVQDVGLTIPASDSVLVCVSEAAWVRLILPDEATIQVGSTLTVKLEVGDYMGSIFDDSQLQFMDLRVHVKDDVLEIASGDIPDQSVANKVFGSSFTVRGANVGVTDLYVSALQKHGRDILSDQRKVEVYLPLSIHPEGLILAPGAHYVISARGGPSVGVSLSYFSNNDTIVSVQSLHGLIAANSPGIAAIYAQVHKQGDTPICKTFIVVKVRVPVSMYLNVRGGQLAIGREMSIFPTGTQEDLFSFFEVCRHYQWTTEEPQVLALLSADDLEGKSEEDPSKGKHVDSRFSMLVGGRSIGKSKVSVAFTCHFHSQIGYSNIQSYTASGIVQVIPDPPLAMGMGATWLLPPNYRTSELLPQLGSDAFDNPSQGKRNIVYSLLQDSSRGSGSIVLEGSHIKTSEMKDISCIQARDRRSGRCEVAVCIRVAGVSQVTVGLSIRAMDISVGASQIYPATLKDNIGSTFFEVGNAVLLTVETNRVDVVSVKVLNENDGEITGNSPILVQALRQGTALVRVAQMWNPSVVDYILVNVGTFISPRNPVLHVGGLVNFSIIGKGQQFGERGQWMSSNSNVLRVNQTAGEAIALSGGIVTVSFNSSHLMAYTTATVLQISSILVEAPGGWLSNVDIPEKGYMFHIKFRDSHGQDVGSVGKDQKVSYFCRVQPAFLGQCIPWSDLEGKSYCAFHPDSPEKLFLTMQNSGHPATLDIEESGLKGDSPFRIVVEALGASVDGSATFLFAGGFTILDKPSEVYLTPTGNTTKLIVVGNTRAVDVSCNRTDVLEVKQISSDKDGHGFGEQAIFEVKVIDGRESFKCKLIFMLPRTGQVEEVPIQYNIKRHQQESAVQQFVAAAVVTLVLLIIPLIICAQLMDLPRKATRQIKDSQPLTGMSTIGGPSAASLDSYKTPQSMSLSRSPPQPYTDYVSKTIEKTPYFRRGVRLFDPAKTY